MTREQKINKLGIINSRALIELAYLTDDELDVFLSKELYYYAGYDMVHKLTNIKNFYWDTKENIINYLKSQCEFIEGTTQKEIDEHIELMFKCYTRSI